ncbi:Protein TSS [Camellia lanceoleosa]|uniref:Protein TSS n=1 Tax=Camellia lanceoleosa TaxID=1840588 RepID=A0ACC0FQ82_9ERIC|nr:Protein TSS [Camellia lanceoleosa]
MIQTLLSLFRSEELETTIDRCTTVASDLEPLEVLTENTTLLQEKDVSIPKQSITQKDENSYDLSDDNVFGSVAMASFKDHGGILPPPVNIPPIPHHSATARVPYGPRLSNGYNRSGNRVARNNKPTFHNGEHNGDGTHFSPPKIMNPHAAEFVPNGQIWVPNGYPASPNGYLASPNGIPMSPNGFPLTPTGFQPSLNGIPLTDGFAMSTISPVESPMVMTKLV